MIDREKLTRWYDIQAPFYSLWRDRYDAPAVTGVGEILDREGVEGPLLDAGCGTGLFSIGLAATHAGWEIDGLDASGGMIAVARRKASGLALDNVAFRQGDVTRLPFEDNRFEAVVAGGLLPNLEDAGPALDEFRRVLRPGGHLVISEADRETMGPGERAFFHVMIWGYRVVSTVLPRYRFSSDWDLRATTVDRAELERRLTDRGFTRSEVVSRSGQLLLHFRSGD